MIGKRDISNENFIKNHPEVVDVNFEGISLGYLFI